MPTLLRFGMTKLDDETKNEMRPEGRAALEQIERLGKKLFSYGPATHLAMFTGEDEHTIVYPVFEGRKIVRALPIAEVCRHGPVPRSRYDGPAENDDDVVWEECEVIDNKLVETVGKDIDWN